MSLYRQLVFAITLLIACLMAGNTFVSVFSTRGYIYEQMQVHAQDAATSLGLSISHAAKTVDEAQIRTFVNVLFDRGYYQQVGYHSFNGELDVKRLLPVEIEGVPAWFMALVDLPPTRGSAEVMSGWFRLGEVEVVSHPGYAYRDLWRIFTEQLWLSLFTALLCYVIAGVGLRYLLRPLKKVEQQAEAICRREFPLQQDLPRTPELRSMVSAMNRMTQKLQSIFREQVELSQALHRDAYIDPVTRLPNRSDFNVRLESFLKSDKGGSSGLLSIIHIAGLSQFNDRCGRSEGDECLRLIGQIIADYPWPSRETIWARRSGADFSVFVPFIDQADGQQLLDDVMARLQSCQYLTDSDELQVYCGAAYDHSVMLGNSLLEDADMALRQAQFRALHKVNWSQTAGAERSRTADQWRQFLLQALEQKRFTFFLQPVLASDQKTTIHREVLCRLLDGEDYLSAGLFLPMAERFGLASAIDRVVLEKLVALYGGTSQSEKYCVNLSPASIASAEFVDWLESFLTQHPALASNLVLELPEYCLAAVEKPVRELGRRVAQYGTRLSLDHFGAAASAFQYLRSLPLVTLKMDRRFVHGIDGNGDNRFFVKSLLQIAHSCDIQLLAEGVETEQEWGALLDLGVDGGQGYYLSRPLPPR